MFDLIYECVYTWRVYVCRTRACKSIWRCIKSLYFPANIALLGASSPARIYEYAHIYIYAKDRERERERKLTRASAAAGFLLCIISFASKASPSLSRPDHEIS